MPTTDLEFRYSFLTVLIDQISYLLEWSGPRHHLPPGYLFLCPFADLYSDILAGFRRPACAAYWSLGPSGAEKLSNEESQNLGFPAIELKMYLRKRSWDGSVYSGLRQFHECKGFIPRTLPAI